MDDSGVDKVRDIGLAFALVMAPTQPLEREIAVRYTFAGTDLWSCAGTGHPLY
jgi:hypothetical protein